MKLIIAIIGAEKCEAVVTALHKQEAYLISASQVVGDGREPGRTTIYRGTEFRVHRPKLRLEIVVDDWFVERVVKAIVQAGSAGGTGQSDDYRVCVMHLDEYVTSEIAQEDRWRLEHEVEDSW